MNKKEFIEMVKDDLLSKRKILRDKMYNDFIKENPNERSGFRVKKTFLKYFNLYIQELQKEAQD